MTLYKFMECRICRQIVQFCECETPDVRDPNGIAIAPGEWQRVEPMPERPSFPEDPVVEAVLRRMHDRAKRGMVDYGVSMEEQRKPVREWLDDAIEELLDAALYLEKVKRLL